MRRTNPFYPLISISVNQLHQLAILGISILLAMVVSAPAGADEITPSHVYQVVDNINAELAAMHTANLSQPVVDEGAPPLTPRNPRHVIQKAREVLLKIETLRGINGLSEDPVPPLPVTEIKPADVKKMVDTAYQELIALRPVFKITKTISPASLQTGKVPTDVYDNLQKASNSLDGLGIPRIVPNDVYRLALMMVDDLEKIRAARGKTDPINAPSDSSGKKPLDVYNHVFEVLETLKTKVETDPSLKVPGGIVLPNHRSGRIVPAHVLDLENNVLAELSSIKAFIGVTTPTVLPPKPQGKTPSKVYDEVNKALALAQSL
jgi:hypothetical protein